GFLTLFATGLAFLTNQTLDIYRQVTWRDKINLLELAMSYDSGDFTTVLSNTGSGPIFASKIIIYWRGGSISQPLNRIIRVNEIETIEKDSKNIKDKHAPRQTVITNFTGVASAQVIDAIANRGDKKSCIEAVLYDATNAVLDQMSSYYESDGRKLVLE